MGQSERSSHNTKAAFFLPEYAECTLVPPILACRVSFPSGIRHVRTTDNDRYTIKAQRQETFRKTEVLAIDDSLNGERLVMTRFNHVALFQPAPIEPQLVSPRRVLNSFSTVFRVRLALSGESS